MPKIIQFAVGQDDVPYEAKQIEVTEEVIKTTSLAEIDKQIDEAQNIVDIATKRVNEAQKTLDQQTATLKDLQAKWDEITAQLPPPAPDPVVPVDPVADTPITP